MRNKQLEHELERIASYNNITAKVSEIGYSEGFYLDINDDTFTYYYVEDLVLDCIELSRRFELVFV